MKLDIFPSPSEEFKDNAKRGFLTAFVARYPALPEKFSWRLLAVRSVAAAFAILAIGACGATVYADGANVAATNPLYPFKRFGEKVMLAVAPPDEHAALEADFASRRLAELGDLKKGSGATSTLAMALSDAAAREISASMHDSEKAGLSDGELANVCRKVFSIVLSSSTAMQGAVLGDAKQIERFTTRCEVGSGNPGLRLGEMGGGEALPSSTTSTITGDNGAKGTGSQAAKGDNGSDSRFLRGDGPMIVTTGTVATSSFGGPEVDGFSRLESRIRAYLDATATSSPSSSIPSSQGGNGAQGGDGEGGQSSDGGDNGGNPGNSAIIELHGGRDILH